MEKIVKFYKAIPNTCLGIVNTVNDSTKLKKIFETIFDKPVSNKVSYHFTSKKINFCFDIMDKGENYIFGTFCKAEHFNNEAFIQKRNPEDDSTGPYLPDPNELMERFTYFLIDYSLGVLVTIHNKNLPSIGRILPEFVWDASVRQLGISVAPYPIENIENYIKKFSKCKDITIALANPHSSGEYVPLKQALKGCEVNSYKVQLNIKEHKSDFFENILQCRHDKSTYESISLTALNEYGLEDTINLMETVLSKKVNIELSSDVIFNSEQIKKVLLKELGGAFTYNH